MLKFIFKIIVLVTVLCLGFTLSGCTKSNGLEVVISPNVLNLESSGGDFTIHADIKYNTDLDVKVYLNDSMDSIHILSTSADSRGELVVKCDIQYIKEIVTAGKMTFKLTVHTKDGISYSGTDTIDVISRGK
jgi:hypothetical protein